MIDFLNTFLDSLPQDVSGIIELLQVLVGVVALMMAPGAVTAAVRRLRGRLVAECRPIVQRQAHGSMMWQIKLTHRSRKLRELSVLIFPESQGNCVRSGRLRTQDDGGLQARGELADGAYTITFERFYRNRQMSLLLTFDRADVPVLVFSGGPVRRRLRLGRREAQRSPELQMYVIHDRLMMALSAFLAVGAFIIGRLVYIYFTYPVLGVL